MTATDSGKALGVAVLVMLLTMAASFPMVAFYASFIEPDHAPEFYREAALWIAPWSSYILGPILFFVCVFWLTKKQRIAKPALFAVYTMLYYVLIDLVIFPVLFNIPFSALLSISDVVSLITKLLAALSGAWLAERKQRQSTGI